MGNSPIERAVRRGQLIERIATQRAALATHSRPLRQALETTDRALAATRSGADYLRQHPAYVAAAVALLVVVKPRRAWRWAKRGFVAWRLWQSLRQRLALAGF